MERELLVYVDRAGAPVLAGRVWARVRAAKESASFEYDASWLGRRDAFALDPELPLACGAFHTGRSLFNAFSDTAPDRWGQTLMRRNERARARLVVDERQEVRREQRARLPLPSAGAAVGSRAYGGSLSLATPACMVREFANEYTRALPATAMRTGGSTR